VTKCQQVVGFYNHNNKYTNNVLFAFVSMNSLILGVHLLDILEINLSTTPSIKLQFVCMFSFLAELDRNTASVLCIHTIVFEVLLRRLPERAEKLRLAFGVLDLNPISS
jgi:hypothetical protein